MTTYSTPFPLLQMKTGTEPINNATGFPNNFYLIPRIITIPQGYNTESAPAEYTEKDILPGFWISNSTFGQCYRIYSIESAPENTNILYNVIVEDIGYYSLSIASELIPTNSDGYIWTLSDDGLPNIFPLNQNPNVPAVSSTEYYTYATDLIARFTSRNYYKSYVQAYQLSNTFQVGNFIYTNPLTQLFEISTSSTENVYKSIGVVTSINSPQTGYFTYRPFGNYNPYTKGLTGTVGTLYYLDSAGNLSTTPGANSYPAYIQTGTGSQGIYGIGPGYWGPTGYGPGICLINSYGAGGSTGLTGPTGPGTSLPAGTNYGDYLYWNGDSYVVGDTGISIGGNAGKFDQGVGSVALGFNAGTTGQGNYAIAIGANAGSLNQNQNSIILNASGTGLSAGNTGFFVNPIRGTTGSTIYTLGYNPISSELTYTLSNTYGTIDVYYNPHFSSTSGGPTGVAYLSKVVVSPNISSTATHTYDPFYSPFYPTGLTGTSNTTIYINNIVPSFSVPISLISVATDWTADPPTTVKFSQLFSASSLNSVFDPTNLTWTMTNCTRGLLGTPSTFGCPTDNNTDYFVCKIIVVFSGIPIQVITS